MAAMQLLIVPRFDSGAVQGLFQGDPQLYHAIARALAVEMTDDGFQDWELRPKGLGNVGLAAVLYYWAGPNPLVLIPLNALLHAVGAIALYLLARIYVRKTSAVVLCLPFVVAPYYMSWYSQPNKESFAWAGVLLFSLGWLNITSTIVSTRASRPVFKSFIGCLIGLVLLTLVRPYAARLIGTAAIIALAVLLFGALTNRLRISTFALRLAPSLAASIICGVAFWLGTLQSDNAVTLHSTPNQQPTDTSVWRKADWLPSFIDNRLFAISVIQRHTFLVLEGDVNPVTREALIDVDHHFGSASDVIRYIPRALQIGLLAPFPNFWAFAGMPSRSVFKNLVPIEMLPVYLGVLGLAIAVFAGRVSLPTFAMAVLLLVVTTVYALAVPHLGALDRYRYPFLTVLAVIGLAQGAAMFFGKGTNSDGA